MNFLNTCIAVIVGDLIFILAVVFIEKVQTDFKRERKRQKGIL